MKASNHGQRSDLEGRALQRCRIFVVTDLVILMTTISRMTAIFGALLAIDRPSVASGGARLLAVSHVVVLCSIRSDDLFWQLMVLAVQEGNVTEEDTVGAHVSRMLEITLRP